MATLEKDILEVARGADFVVNEIKVVTEGHMASALNCTGKDTTCRSGWCGHLETVMHAGKDIQFLSNTVLVPVRPTKPGIRFVPLHLADWDSQGYSTIFLWTSLNSLPKMAYPVVPVAEEDRMNDHEVTGGGNLIEIGLRSPREGRQAMRSTLITFLRYMYPKVPSCINAKVVNRQTPLHSVPSRRPDHSGYEHDVLAILLTKMCSVCVDVGDDDLIPDLSDKPKKAKAPFPGGKKAPPHPSSGMKKYQYVKPARPTRHGKGLNPGGVVPKIGLSPGEQIIPLDAIRDHRLRS